MKISTYVILVFFLAASCHSPNDASKKQNTNKTDTSSLKETESKSYTLTKDSVQNQKANEIICDSLLYALVQSTDLPKRIKKLEIAGSMNFGVNYAIQIYYQQEDGPRETFAWLMIKKSDTQMYKRAPDDPDTLLGIKYDTTLLKFYYLHCVNWNDTL